MADVVLKPVSQELILDRLRFENPWWRTGLIESDYEKMPRRLYFDFFYARVIDKDVRRSVVLMGPRRVGKTVMMHHAISQLLKEISPRKIAFVNIENPIFMNCGLEQIFGFIRSAVANNSLEGWYIFFDEIQYLPEWEVHLKVLVDSYRDCRFIASGSAAAALKIKSRESGAGRFTDFMLPPLTFQEYLHLKEKDSLVFRQVIPWGSVKADFYSTSDIKELNREFLNYLNYGGYPEVIFSDRIRSNPGLYIRSDIIDKVLLRDLPSLYGIADVQELYRLFVMIAYNSGAEISYQSLAIESGINKKTLQNYLTYLEAAYLIKVVHRVDDTAKTFKRTDFFKTYLTNPSLRTALFAPLDPTDDAMGAMVETGIYAQWLHREWDIPHYARWSKNRMNGEVDMIGLDAKKMKPRWAVEIKWSNRYIEQYRELKSLFYFCEQNGLNNATITSIDKFAETTYKDITLHFLPSSLYAFAVGANTLLQKKQNEVPEKTEFPFDDHFDYE
jgi:predicted AAA+ superfamily ATPase